MTAIARNGITCKGSHRLLSALLHGCCTKLSTRKPEAPLFSSFAGLLEWAMLGSNQRPLPCEGGLAIAAVYRQEPQNRINKRFLRICAVNTHR
jgi:hypothetical protein